MSGKPQPARQKAALNFTESASEKSHTGRKPDSAVESTQNQSEEYRKRQSNCAKSAVADEEAMDKILFEDDSKTGEFLKGLISSQGLRGAWSKLCKRMSHIEEASGLLKQRADMTGEELEKAFTTRKECQDIVIEETAETLSKHKSHLQSLEASSDATLRRFEVNEKDLAGIHDELAKHFEVVGVVQKDLVDLKKQDEDHHQETLDLHQQLADEIRRQEVSFEEACSAIRDRQEDDTKYRVGLETSLQELKDFLYSAGLQKQLEKICCDMLMQYVSWEDMKQEKMEIHTNAVSSATGPLQNDIEQLRQALEASNQSLTAKDAALNSDINMLGDRVNVINQKFIDRIDDVVGQVQQRAMDSRLSDVEKRLLARDEYMESDFSEFKELQTRKIEDSFDRVQELESTIFAHEHALQHWAEEIGNRATKYDMMVISARVDKCSLKDKADADFKEVQKTLKWQSVKIENLTFKSNFGGKPGDGSARRSSRSKKSPRRPSQMNQESPPASDDESRRQTEEGSGTAVHEESPDRKASSGEDAGGSGEPSSPVSPKVAVQTPKPATPNHVAAPTWEHKPDSELMAMLQQQLESLAHCVLGLTNMALRTATCGLSREAKVHSEERLTFNIAKLLYWISHRAAPPDWDPLELQSLAIKLIDENEEKRRDSSARSISRSLSRQASPDHTRRRKGSDHCIGEGKSERHPARGKRFTRSQTHPIPGQDRFQSHQSQDSMSRQASKDGGEMQMGTSQTERVSAHHQPNATSQRQQDHLQSSKERAERRQNQWVEKGCAVTQYESTFSDSGTPSVSTQSLEGGAGTTKKKKAVGSSSQLQAASQGQERRAAPKAVSAENQETNPLKMQELVIDIFGNKDSKASSRPSTTSKVPGHVVRGSTTGFSAQPDAGSAIASDLALPRLQTPRTAR